ncbi:MAG: hypothetical protein ABJA11_09155, partial [Pseudolysinimonas sp.]
MSEPASAGAGDAEAAAEPATNRGADLGASRPVDLADGEWHRLHPATPLLRGGFAFVAIAGFVLANLRERILGLFLGGSSDGGPGGDPIDVI